MAIIPSYKADFDLSSIIPYARNSRTHSEAQVAQIAASIKEFGFTNPILIDEKGGIIAGHGRALAAQKLGLKTVPVITLAHLTETQRKAYVIADNKLALNAGWDEELLRLEFDELSAAGFDLELTGFSLDEIDGLGFDSDEEGDIEQPRELKEESYSEMFNIIVKCNDEIHQEMVYHKLTKEGLICQVQSL